MSNCPVPPQPFRDTCGLQAPNVDVYKGACGALTAHQFEFPDIRAYNSTGGGKARKSPKARRVPKVPKAPKALRARRAQKGGDSYTFDLTDRIGGLPARVGIADPVPYDCRTSSSSAPVQTGGKMHYLTRTMSNSSFIQQLNGGSKKKVSRKGKKRSDKKRSDKKRSRTIRQRGGMMDYSQAYNGSPSVFTDNMIERQFDCRQPNWVPKCT